MSIFVCFFFSYRMAGSKHVTFFSLGYLSQTVEDSVRNPRFEQERNKEDCHPNGNGCEKQSVYWGRRGRWPQWNKRDCQVKLTRRIADVRISREHSDRVAHTRHQRGNRHLPNVSSFKCYKFAIVTIA